MKRLVCQLIDQAFFLSSLRFMNNYFRQLDALRFISVTMVILVHLPLMSLDEGNFFKIFSSYISGVSLFFCISGFLITSILLANHNNDRIQVLKSFYLRRFIRIFPIYYLTILMLYLLNINGYREWVINDLLYISNIVQGINGEFGGTVAPHFWSLAVEEQFYLIWPTFFLLIRSKWSLLLALALFCTGVLATYISEYSFLMARTLTCLTYLGSGAVLAVLHYKDEKWLNKNKKFADIIIATSFLVMALVSLGYLKLNWYFTFALGALMIPALVWRFSIGYKNIILKNLFENRAVLYLGKISYGLYVYHLLMLYPAVAIKKVFSIEFLNDPLKMQIFKILLAIIVSAISWELFEKQINKFKNKFPYSRSDSKL